MKTKNPKRVSLRTKKTEDIYQEYLKSIPVGFCPFCEGREPIKRFHYWIIIPNNFPYDDIYSESHLLVCRRHIESIEEMTVAEYKELEKIKKDILDNGIYNQIVENSAPRRTVKPHYHLHLLNF